MTSIVINTQVGLNRGVPRIWLEGQKLALAGLEIGSQLAVRVNQVQRRLEIEPVKRPGLDAHTVSLSKRERNGTVSPVLELRGTFLEQLFAAGSKVRIAIRKGVLLITQAVSDMRIAERVKRFKEKMEAGTALAVTSLFHGGGILDSALHSGLNKAGVKSFVQVGVELEDEYMESSLRNNPELWTKDSFAIIGDVREVNVLGSIPQTDLLYAGIPCTGASKSGRSKNKLQCAEEHSAAGTMFFDFLQWLKATNPAVFVIENVPEYSNTSSMTVIRSVAENLGYVLSETILDGNELGALEKRRRLCVVGITPGIGNPLDFEQLVPLREKEPTLASILENVPLDSDLWKSFSYLADKEVRDKAAGKGFARQLLKPESETCGTIGKGYAKCRSTEPFITHPEDASLSRILTPAEHARVKAIPENIINGLSNTAAHEVLGQSVIYPAFQAVGFLLGLTLKGMTYSAERIAASMVQSCLVEEKHQMMLAM